MLLLNKQISQTSNYVKNKLKNLQKSCFSQKTSVTSLQKFAFLKYIEKSQKRQAFEKRAPYLGYLYVRIYVVISNLR